MTIDRNIQAVAAEIAAQDADLLEEFGNRARWGGGEYAVAYSVLRAVQMVGRFVVAGGLDDDERAAAQRSPGAAAVSPEPAALAAAAPAKVKKGAKAQPRETQAAKETA